MPQHHRAIVERMRWVLDSGRVESASSWATAANLSRTYVTAFMDRARRGVVNDIGVNNLAALAEVARVSPAWLAYGYGPVDEPANLKRLAARLPKGSYSEEILRQAACVREIIGEADLPEDVWEDYVDGLKKEARRVGLQLTGTKLDRRGLK